RLHRRHSGALLAAKAVDQSAVYKARKIAGHNSVQNRRQRRCELKGTEGGILLHELGKLLPVKRQKPCGYASRHHAVFEVGVYDIYLVELLLLKTAQEGGAYLPRPVHGGVLGGKAELSVDGHLVPYKMLSAVFAH